MTRQGEFDGSDSHVVNIGRIVEEMEGKMRGSLAEIYFGKTMDIAGGLRGADDGVDARRVQEQINQGLSSK